MIGEKTPITRSMPSSTFVLVASFAVPVVIACLLSISDTDPSVVYFPPLRELPSNTRQLKNVERLFDDDPTFKGPESFVVNKDGTFFTGLADGRVVRVSLKDIPSYTEVVRTGSFSPECGSLSMETTCGRPLGMRQHPHHEDCVIVADAYKGLLWINTTNGEKRVLVEPAEYNLTLINDLDVDANNTGRFQRNQIHKMLIEARPTGCVLGYDLKTGVVRVLAPDLIMPNGVTLTHDKKALLVTVMNGIVRIDLPNNQKGLSTWDNSMLKVRSMQHDLQGTPDNIRRNNRGTYFVALGSKRAKPFSLPQTLAPFIVIRKLTSLFDLETMTKLIPLSCLMVEVNDYGEVVETFRDLTKVCYWLSEVEQLGEDLLLGSWRTPFLARAKLG